MELLLVFGLFGLAYGAVLQRSGFCIARAALELFLLRSREALNGLLAGLCVATLGFTAVTVMRARAGLPALDHLLVLPFGAATLVGGMLFGAGMTLAGMCAAGTLQRLGEGYMVGWVSLAGMTLGAAFDPFRSFLPTSWQLQSGGFWLGRVAGAPAAAAVTVASLLVVWVVIRGKPGTRPRRLLTPAVVGGVVLGLLNTAQVAVAAPWTVAYPLGLLPPALSGGIAPAAVRGALPLLALDAGLVLGSGLATATQGRYRLRWPRRARDVAVTLVGGVLMGWGLQLARGCSIGGGFSALPSLSASAWLFLPGLLLGAGMGAWAMRRLR